MGMPKSSARNDTELLDLETKHQKAEEMATNIVDLLGKSLAKACWKPESRQQSKPRREKVEESNMEQASLYSAKNGSKDGYERPISHINTFLRS
ncbi:hypothetical protein GUJ93_ZPchr0014g46618 [Zizania palustris]|uniref:Uncharacterized protein n=1 Tax=Zizania palustris TaxID=103762 RepID=A0A8J5TKT4_ZIZPA|nr:hypothetical protein GUJ93_ZPchr0014g46618 [Zizania palustris]